MLLEERNKSYVRIKKFMEEEFKVVDFTEGTGDDKGTVIWTCEMKDKQTILRVAFPCTISSLS